jgi:signal peptidase II
MQRNNPFKDWRVYASILIVAVLIIADQLTKNWIRSHPLNSEITGWGFIRIINIHNMGSAFGMFQGQATPLKIIAIVSLVVFVILGVLIYRRFHYLANKWNVVAYSLVVGGTCGNLIDRIRFGTVTDFVDTGFWPVFNIADSAISVGAVMVGLALISVAIKDRKK